MQPTTPDQMIMSAQAHFQRFKAANMLEKPAHAEAAMQLMLDAVQMMAADIRLLRNSQQKEINIRGNADLMRTGDFNG
jgi:hypothetical protein